ncbi:MAG: GTPase HflX [Flavobacteriales bacterium]|nr:GTPase HflX [Flavobacteriales bacterium]|tara:strand:+ start:3655 stop:4818 length:1164 start_codon:yes stop_codon:yes gene_type:complete
MEKVVLIGAITAKTTESEVNEYLRELEFLAFTAGGDVKKIFKQKINHINSKTFLGKGKIHQIRDFIADNAIETAIFDDELTPSQQKNLEEHLCCKIVDRTNLILTIFALRAKTAIAKIQVELAQHQYFLPRLTNLWTHLSKQKGGIGMRGPGEKEIETDRRIIRQQISLLKKKLEKIDKQMTTQRKGRNQLVRVSLIGYTNAGKSTIMNSLSKSNVLAEDKLFATLDTTVRKVVIKNLPFLLSDTVGFIRKLPTQLIKAFKSTLDEVHESDLLIHVIDISNPNFEKHIEAVQKTLQEINCVNKKQIMVFNKIDQYTYIEKDEDDLSPIQKENLSLDYWKKSWMSKENTNTIFISCLKQTNTITFKETLYTLIENIQKEKYPYNNFLY